MSEAGTLFCFGMGFAGKTLGRLLLADGWRVIGTCRSAESCVGLEAQGFEALSFSGDKPGLGVFEALQQATHVLNSIPPDEDGDPLLRQHQADIAAASDIGWIGLLSTVGVYGEHHGGWVDEQTPPAPVARRSKLRHKAEQQWQAFGAEIGKQPHIFRLPGIYGPGRNQLMSLRRGKARRLVKPGQVFNRVHATDIAKALHASMCAPEAGYLFNVTDDEPAPPQEVVAYAAELMGKPPPPEVDFETAELTPMARSFYGECKRVRNDLMKHKLGIELTYPTYREGLKALHDELLEGES